MFDALRDLLFTPSCIGCNQLGTHVCSQCLSTLTPQSADELPTLERIVSASTYGGWVRDALIAYKNGSRQHVSGLAQVLHCALRAFDDLGPLVVVPIPSSPSKIRARGFDTVSLLARECMKLQPRPSGSISEALAMSREVADQVGLSASARQRNVAHSMVARQAIQGNVLLIDDVITTGSTMREGARALHLAGVRKVFGISLCGSVKWG